MKLKNIRWWYMTDEHGGKLLSSAVARVMNSNNYPIVSFARLEFR